MTRSPGYIALVSAMVISALLMAVTFSLSFTGFFTRRSILDHEFKERSLGLAEACAETAVLKASIADPPYTGNEPIVVGSDSCFVRPLLYNTPSSGKITIQTQAIIPASGAFRTYSNYELVVDDTTFAIESWQEKASF